VSALDQVLGGVVSCIVLLAGLGCSGALPGTPASALPEPSSSPTSTPTIAPTITPTLTPTATPLPAPAPTPLPTPTPSATPRPAPAPAPTITPVPVPPAQRLVTETVARGLEVPWALAFAPDGRLFLTERPGRIRVVQDGVLLPEPAATLEVAHVVEAGLMGLALDPDFASNHYLYVYYTYSDNGGRLWNRVERFIEEGNRLKEPKVIIDGIPGASIHDGGRIKFGPDGKLYVTTGDASRQDLSQDLSSLAGKVLRLNPDGSIPADNPFSRSPVYSYGHRNPQGLAWHPVTGQLFATEHGPTGFDEVNILQPGKNYGWPLVRGIARQNQYVDPIMHYSPAIAPSGAAFYSGDRYQGWKNHLFFTTLRGEHLHRIALKGPEYGEIAEEERLFSGDLGRLRDVVQGPDGYLYVATSNRDGRGSPARDDDRILRIRVDGSR